MTSLHLQRLLTTAAILGALSLAAAAQQTPEQQPPAQQPSPAPSAEPQAGPGGPNTLEAAPSETPKAPAVKPSEAPATQSLVGLIVFSSDGTRVGEVRSVDTGPNGTIVGLHVRTGGFLGFGGRIVAIPEGKFIRSGQSIRIDLDSDEVTGLPEVKD